MKLRWDHVTRYQELSFAIDEGNRNMVVATIQHPVFSFQLYWATIPFNSNSSHGTGCKTLEEAVDFIEQTFHNEGKL